MIIFAFDWKLLLRGTSMIYGSFQLPTIMGDAIIGAIIISSCERHCLIYFRIKEVRKNIKKINDNHFEIGEICYLRIRKLLKR